MRRMITQKMIDYIKSIQVKSFSPEDVEYLKTLEEVIDYDEEDGIAFSPKVSFEDDVAIGGDAQIDGDLNVAGDLGVTGDVNGLLKAGITFEWGEDIEVDFLLSKKIEDVNLLQFKLGNNTGNAIASGTTIGQCSYFPQSTIQFVGFASSSACVFSINTAGNVIVYVSGSIASGAKFGGSALIQIVSE